MRVYIYALCGSGAVNAQVFVWKFLSAVYKFSFIQKQEEKKVHVSGSLTCVCVRVHVWPRACERVFMCVLMSV